MNLFNIFFVYIFSAIFGSFLGVLVDRLPTGESVLFSRSRCKKCGHELTFIDLFPIISYLLLRGKCRYCKTGIPKRLLFFEIGLGAAGVGLFLYSQIIGLSLFETVYLAVVFFCLLGIFFADIIYGIIPDQFNIVIVVAAIIFIGTANPSTLPWNILTAVCSFAIFLFLYLVTGGRGMGFGDVKFAFVMGLFLGFPAILTGLYTAFLTAAAVSIILVVLGRKKLHGGTIAFGPFLASGTIFAYFFGERIIGLFI